MVAVVLESDLWLWVLRCSESESVYFPAVLVRLSAMCLRANWNFSTPPSWPPDVKSQLTGKDPDAEKDWGQEKKGVRADEMFGCITKSMDMNLSKLREIVKDRGAWPAVVHGVTKSQIRLSNWTTTTPPTPSCPVSRFSLLLAVSLQAQGPLSSNSLATSSGQFSAQCLLSSKVHRIYESIDWSSSQCCDAAFHAHAQSLFYSLWLVWQHSSVT